MKCPICNVDLLMSERQGIEIDYCPECRGIWLDRGELDKLIEKSSQNNPGSLSPISFREENNYQSKHNNENHGYYKKHKKESWLGEIFDF